MSRFWSPALHDLTPYTPGEQPRQRLVKLNTNENPYAPAPGVRDLLDHFDTQQLRLYPDPESTALRQTLAEVYQVPVECIFVGNGSDEVLALAFAAFFRQPEPLLMPSLSYSFYPVYCNLYGINAERIPLAEDWSVDLDAFDRPNGGIAIANPNAPTGHAHKRDAIANLLARQKDKVVLVDEAYVDFGAESCLPLIPEHDNLLIVSTFSKSRSLAGLRIGFAIGSRELIEGLERIKNAFNSYPIDRLAEQVAIVSLKDQEHFEKTRQAIIDTRTWSVEALRQRHFDVLPSNANFVLARPTARPAVEVFNALREQGIVVRYFNTPGLSDWLRISIGTDDEMQQLINALDGILPGEGQHP